jgi:hypothetical protein
MSSPYSDSKNKRCRKPAWNSVYMMLFLLHASRWFLVWCILQPCWWSWQLPLKRRLTFDGLHGVMSQKKRLSITTAVRSSNPTTKGLPGAVSPFFSEGEGKLSECVRLTQSYIGTDTKMQHIIYNANYVYQDSWAACCSASSERRNFTSTHSSR